MIGPTYLFDDELVAEHTKKSLAAAMGGELVFLVWSFIKLFFIIEAANKEEKGTNRPLIGTRLSDVFKLYFPGHGLETAASVNPAEFGMYLKGKPLTMLPLYSRYRRHLRHHKCGVSNCDIKQCDARWCDRRRQYEWACKQALVACGAYPEHVKAFELAVESMGTYVLNYKNCEGICLKLQQFYGTVTGSMLTKHINSDIVAATHLLIQRAIKACWDAGYTMGCKTAEEMILEKSFTGDDMSIVAKNWQVLALICMCLELFNVPQKPVQTVGSTRVVFLQKHVTSSGIFQQLARVMAGFIFQREAWLTPPTLMQCFNRVVELAQKAVQRGASLCSYRVFAQMGSEMFLFGRSDLANTNIAMYGLGGVWPDSFPLGRVASYQFRDLQTSPVLHPSSRPKFKSVVETLNIEMEEVYAPLQSMYPGLRQSEEHLTRVYQTAVSTMRTRYSGNVQLNKLRFQDYVSSSTVQVPFYGYAYADSVNIIKYFLGPYMELLVGILNLGDEEMCRQLESLMLQCPLFRLDAIARDCGQENSQALDDLIRSMQKLNNLEPTSSNYLSCLADIYESRKVTRADIHRQNGYRTASEIINATSAVFGQSKLFSSVISSTPGDEQAKQRFSGLQEYRGVMKSGGRCIDPHIDELVAAVVQQISICVAWNAISKYIPELTEYYHPMILDRTRPLSVLMGLIRNCQKYICAEWFVVLDIQGPSFRAIQSGRAMPSQSIEEQLDMLLSDNIAGVLNKVGIISMPDKYKCTDYVVRKTEVPSDILDSHVIVSKSDIVHAKIRLSRLVKEEVSQPIREIRVLG